MATTSAKLPMGSQKKAIADTLGNAFSKDPFMSYIFPDATTRVQNLTKLFLPIINCASAYGGVEMTPEADAAILWLSGKNFPLTLLQLIRSGLVWMPWQIGLPAFNRLQSHETVCEHKLQEKAPDGFAYIWILGVHPKSTGQGLGKQMLQSALNSMQKQGYSTCFLRTDTEANVAFYKHMGFKEVYTEIVPASQLQYWIFSKSLG